MKAYKDNKENIGYFEELPKSTQEFIRETILEVASERGGPEGWKQDDECIEEVECRHCDGFIPFDHNRGGLEYNNFTDLNAYFGGGYSCNHKGAAKEIERQIAYGLECALEYFQKDYAAELKGIPKKKHNYHDLYELNRSDLAEKLSEYEMDNLGSESSIMHSFRFLYHGCVNGVHSASISAAINTEGPYYRSHISWAPGVFCEGAKEIEITWRTESGLKRKLKKALKQVSEAIF